MYQPVTPVRATGILSSIVCSRLFIFSSFTVTVLIFLLFFSALIALGSDLRCRGIERVSLFQHR